MHSWYNKTYTKLNEENWNYVYTELFHWNIRRRNRGNLIRFAKFDTVIETTETKKISFSPAVVDI